MLVCCLVRESLERESLAGNSIHNLLPFLKSRGHDSMQAIQFVYKESENESIESSKHKNLGLILA
jgi:hypothetical protein